MSIISKLICKFDIIIIKCPTYLNENMKLVTKNKYMKNNKKILFLVELNISKAI